MEGITRTISVEDAKQYVNCELMREEDKYIVDKDGKNIWIPVLYRIYSGEEIRIHAATVWGRRIRDAAGKPALECRVDKLGRLEFQRAAGVVDQNLRAEMVGYASDALACTVKTVKAMLPQHGQLLILSRDQAKRDKFIIKGKDRYSLGHIMSLIRFIPGLKGIHSFYSGMISDEVVMAKDPTDYGDYLTKIGISSFLSKDTPSKRNVHEMVCAGYTVLLMMTKSLNPTANGVNDNVQTFIGKRLSALCSANPQMFEHVQTETFASTNFDIEHLIGLSRAMSAFPKFKSAIFTCVIMGDNPHLDHMNKIFAESSMTVFTIIFKFLSSPIITELHVNRILFSEMKQFQKAYDKLKDMLGGSWRYYKLIEPNGLETAQGSLKLLGQAALSWQVIQPDGGESLRELKGVKPLKRFEEMAAKFVPENCMSSPNVSTFSQFSAGMTEAVPILTVNWANVDKWQKAGVVAPGLEDKPTAPSS